MNIQELAKEAAGNWQHFKSFAWHDRHEVESPESWAIVYTHNRDSGLLDQSNADAIKERMAAFGEDVREESHGHWACGWVDGLAIRVYGPNGQITKAFEEWCAIEEELENYPVLDEEDYCEREYDATMENLGEALWQVWNRVRGEHYGDMPDDLAGDVYRWLGDNMPGELQGDSCDRGGYPSDASIEAALDALGYPEPEEIEG